MVRQSNDLPNDRDGLGDATERHAVLEHHRRVDHGHLLMHGGKHPTLAIDFDGVIHDYSEGWRGGEVYGDLVPGTAEALRQLSKNYKLVVFTARFNLPDVHAFLHRKRIEHLFEGVTNVKPMAVAYIDDRAFHFDNWAGVLAEFSRAP